MTPSGLATDPLHTVVDTGGTGSLGAVTIADGANVAQGTTSDASSANTVIGILKNLKAALAGALTVNATNVLKAAGAPTTQAAVAMSTTTADVLVSNGSALYRQIQNVDPTNGVTLKLGSGAATDYAGIYLPPNSVWDGWSGDRFYTGLVRGKSVAGTPTLAVVEG